MSTALQEMTVTRSHHGYRMPCGHGSLDPDTPPGVHQCPDCQAPALLTIEMQPICSARVLAPAELAAIADIPPDQLDTIAPADVAAMVERAYQRRFEIQIEPPSGMPSAWWLVPAILIGGAIGLAFLLGVASMVMA